MQLKDACLVTTGPPTTQAPSMGFWTHFTLSLFSKIYSKSLGKFLERTYKVGLVPSSCEGREVSRTWFVGDSVGSTILATVTGRANAGPTFTNTLCLRLLELASFDLALQGPHLSYLLSSPSSLLPHQFFKPPICSLPRHGWHFLHSLLWEVREDVRG